MAKTQKPAIPPTQALAVRAQAIQLASPVKAFVEDLDLPHAQTWSPEQYLQADGALGRVRTVRALIEQKLEPIVSPLQRALDAAKLAVKESKKAMEGADALKNELEAPLIAIEDRIKGAMRTFKYEEARQLRAADEAREEEAARLREEEAALERQETAARTAGMRARLAQMRADVAAKAEAVEERPEPTPVKGTSSSDRTLKKIRVKDLALFLAAMQDYQPSAGIYRNRHPPLSIIDPEMLQVALNKAFKEQPGIVKSWPGCEEYDDIIIAKR